MDRNTALSALIDLRQILIEEGKPKIAVAVGVGIEALGQTEIVRCKDCKHLMLPLDDAVNVVGRICDEWWTLEDGDIEFIRNELEQKCYRIDQTTDCISRKDAIEALEHIHIPTQAQREYAWEIFGKILPVTPTVSEGCISRQQAIDGLCQNCEAFDCIVNGSYCGHDCTEVAILKNLPPVNQKQVTGKLKTLDDSLLTDDSEACKEQKSKLESDLISRQAAIEAVANHFMTDALIRNPSASNDIEDWKKIAERVLSNLPPVTPKEQQEHGRLIDADKLLQELFNVDEEEWTTPEIRTILENAPPVEPERPKGKWKYGNGNGECPFCGRERQYGWDNFCGFCGADMRGNKE